MAIFIAIVAFVFVGMIVLLKFDKIKEWFSNHKLKLPKVKKEKEVKQPKEVKEEKKDSKISYEEYKPEIKVDKLHKDVEYTESSFNSLTEDENKELTNSSKGKGGRMTGDIQGVKDLKVEVEDLGEYNEDEGFMDAEDNFDEQEENENEDFANIDTSDLFFDEFDLESSLSESKEKSISEEIRNLSPEVKALLIDNVLKRKDN